MEWFLEKCPTGHSVTESAYSIQEGASLIQLRLILYSYVSNELLDAVFLYQVGNKLLDAVFLYLLELNHPKLLVFICQSTVVRGLISCRRSVK